TGDISIPSLALGVNSANTKAQSVQLLGRPDKITWSHDEQGLRFTVPGEKPCDYAICLKIQPLS
ncbi:MAG TPA: alpha-L-fucosidase, partial [Candidatus Angelobacter sp.]|nr:alpha-L-fucosidase [Candidatus Angelobacter sp.]